LDAINIVIGQNEQSLSKIEVAPPNLGDNYYGQQLEIKSLTKQQPDPPLKNRAVWVSSGERPDGRTHVGERKRAPSQFSFNAA